MIKYFLTALFFGFAVYTTAQTNVMVGKVVDATNGTPLVGAVVSINDKGIATDPDGRFRFGLEDFNVNDSLTVKISFLGFKTYSTKLMVPEGKFIRLGQIKLAAESKMLDEVKVEEKIPATEQRGDTIGYNARAFKTAPDAKAEDLIRKMPGMTIENGTVKAQGEEVKRVTIDGRFFFGDDPMMALSNLPARSVERVEVFDAKSDLARFTGFDDGNTTKTMNIVTSQGARNSVFGNASGAVGTDDHYIGKATIHRFNDDQRISILGLANNINQQNFSSQDLSALSPGMQMHGGRHRPGMGAMPESFTTNSSSGITETFAGGLNYSDMYGKNLSVTGSAFLNYGDNLSRENLQRTWFPNTDTAFIYNQNQNTNKQNVNGRINLRIEYSPSPTTIISYNPVYYYQSNKQNINIGSFTNIPDNINNSSAINSLQNGFTANTQFTNDFTLRQSLKKKGRTLALTFNSESRTSDGNSDLFTYGSPQPSDSGLQQTIWPGYTNKVSGGVYATETIFKILQFAPAYRAEWMEVGASANVTNGAIGAVQQPDSMLSNKFVGQWMAHGPEIGFRGGTPKLRFGFRLYQQFAQMQTHSLLPETPAIKTTHSHFLPMGMFFYKINKKNSVRFFFRTRADMPNTRYLQNVINNQNPQNIQIGNPNLIPSHNFGSYMRYTFTNPKNNLSVYGSASYSVTRNYIGNQSVILTADGQNNSGLMLPLGSTITTYGNMQGYWQTDATTGLGIPYKKQNINFEVSQSVTQTPSIVRNISSYATNNATSARLSTASNINERIDFQVIARTSYNNVLNRGASSSTLTYWRHMFEWRAQLENKVGTVMRLSGSQTWLTGLGTEFNTNFLLINATIGQRLLKDKSLEINITAYDLLNQNTDVARTVGDVYIEDTRNLVLTQYFMLTLNYNFNRKITPKTTAEK